MSVRIRPLRLEALECRLAPASMSSLLPPVANGLGLGHSPEFAPRDDGPRGLSVAALARGLSESSTTHGVNSDVNVSLLGVGAGLSLGIGLGAGVSTSISIEVSLTPGSRPHTPLIDVEVSVGTGTNTPPVRVPPVNQPPVNGPPSGEATGPAQPPVAVTPISSSSSTPLVPTAAVPNAVAAPTVTPAVANQAALLPVNLAANQTAATLSQTPAVPFLFLSPTSLTLQQQQQQFQQQAAVPIQRVTDVGQEANVVATRPQNQTPDFAPGGGDVPEDAPLEQLVQPPTVEPQAEAVDPAKLGLEAVPPELGINGNQADDNADGEEGELLVTAGFAGEGGLPSWLIFVVAVSALAVARLATPLPRRRYYDHLLLADDFAGRADRPD